MFKLEDENIYDSHEILLDLLERNLDKNLAIEKFLKTVCYPTIGEFKKGLQWFNVSEPLTFQKHLFGKVVLLDFFTYCCINCMHILPDLKELENQFTEDDGFVVIGVHSPKFSNEKQSSNIASAVQRMQITHPVVNDHELDTWQRCQVACWPTLLVLAPGARPILMLMGEGHKELLMTFIKNALNFYKREGSLIIGLQTHLPLKPTFHMLPDLAEGVPLLFPGKIASCLDENGDEVLAISDTGNNRILLVKNGIVIEQIGTGLPGFRNGSFAVSSFQQPQGVCFGADYANTIYVADTENHSIRKIDLRTKLVDTLVGNGSQSEDKEGGKVGTLQGLSSPWDVQFYRYKTSEQDPANKTTDYLLIAMAGTHQIWAVFLLDADAHWPHMINVDNRHRVAGTALCIAGTGSEENRNNARADRAAFAQPSGLAISASDSSDGHRWMYVADSESSAIRKIDLKTGAVGAVVGGDIDPKNLFAFGDKDGIKYTAKLQHPLGVALSRDDMTLYIADTYNHKIKAINLPQNAVCTLRMPRGDQNTNFNEPSALCYSKSANKLYVADTNNHQIKVLHIDDAKCVSKIEKLHLSLGNEPKSSTLFNTSRILNAKSSRIYSKGSSIDLTIKFVFLNNLQLTRDAPQHWYVDTPNIRWHCDPSEGNSIDGNVRISIALPSSEKTTETFNLHFDLVTCTGDLCYPKRFSLRKQLEFCSDGPRAVVDEIIISLEPKNINIMRG